MLKICRSNKLLACGVAALLITSSAATAETAPSINLTVGWKTGKFDDIWLQTNAGRSEFSRQGNKFVISHNRSKFGERVTVNFDYGGSKATIALYPYRNEKKFGFTLDVVKPSGCGDTFVRQQVSRAARVDNYDSALSLIVQAQLLEDSGCPAKQRDNLNFIKANAGCHLTALNDFFTAVPMTGSIYRTRLDGCIQAQQNRLGTILINGLKQYARTTDFKRFVDKLEEIQAYRQDPMWNQSFEELGWSTVDDGHLEVQNLYTLTIKNRSNGNLEEAAKYSSILAEKAEQAKSKEQQYDIIFDRAMLDANDALNINANIMKTLETANMRAIPSP